MAAGLFLALATLALIGALGRDDDRRQAVGLWNMDLVETATAWDVTRGAGATVAVIDTGVDTRHPDLADRVVATVDCVGADGDPDRCRAGGDTDPDGHGTHVAGLVAAAPHDAHGVVGVAPDARLLAVRALEAARCDRRPCGGTGRGTDVAAGLRWAVQAGADVANLSLGPGAGGVGDDLLSAIEEAWAADVVVVVAGPTRRVLTDLAGAPAVVVTAVDAQGRPAPYDTPVDGARWALAAPGGSERAPTGDGCRADHAVRSTVAVPGGARAAYGCLVGTSMAAPHVAGAAALLRATGLAADETVDRLLATADDRGRPGPDPSYGAGLLDVGAALDPASRATR